MVKKQRNIDPAKRERALEMLAAGNRVTDVARALEVNMGAVAYWNKVRKAKGANGLPPTEAVNQPRDTRIDMALSCLREIRRALEAQTGHRYSRNDHYAMLALSWLEGKR